MTTPSSFDEVLSNLDGTPRDAPSLVEAAGLTRAEWTSFLADYGHLVSEKDRSRVDAALAAREKPAVVSNKYRQSNLASRATPFVRHVKFREIVTRYDLFRISQGLRDADVIEISVRKAVKHNAGGKGSFKRLRMWSGTRVFVRIEGEVFAEKIGRTYGRLTGGVEVRRIVIRGGIAELLASSHERD